jgi:hypothetical protein
MAEIHHPKTMTTPVKFELRRDTAANWNNNNPILLQGEPGFDLTNNQLRIGDGSANWNGLKQLDVKTNDAVAIGGDAGGGRAGYTGQMDYAVAIGSSAGSINQQESAIAIGVASGQYEQQTQCVAIGNGAG